MRRVLVISHRTQMGTHAENSLSGIEAALASSVDGVEVDVRATLDGAAVLMHDASLLRTTGDGRDLSAVTAAELGELRLVGGEPVPSLAQALAAVDGRATLYIEVKEAGVEPAVAQAVRAAHGEEWCWVWAFDPRVASRCRELLPEVPAALNVAPGLWARLRGDLDADYVATAVRLGFAAVSVAHELVEPSMVERAHRRGLAVYTWTVDAPEAIDRVLAAGVDAVCSNFPARVQAALSA